MPADRLDKGACVDSADTCGCADDLSGNSRGTRCPVATINFTFSEYRSHVHTRGQRLLSIADPTFAHRQRYPERHSLHCLCQYGQFAVRRVYATSVELREDGVTTTEITVRLDSVPWIPSCPYDIPYHCDYTDV